MTDDIRARRVAVLTAAAKTKSQAKTKAAEQAVRAQARASRSASKPSNAKPASRTPSSTVTRNSAPRIERLRAQARPASPPPDPADAESTLVHVLTTQIQQLKRQHQQEVQAFRAALEQAHCENLELRRELARRGDTSVVASIAETI